jgi:hypothetical protein
MPHFSMSHSIKKSVSQSMVKVMNQTLGTRCRKFTFQKRHSSTGLSKTMCSCAFGLTYLELLSTSSGICSKNKEEYSKKMALQLILIVTVFT